MASNKDIVLRFYEEFEGKKNLGIIEELFDKSFRYKSSMPPGAAPNRWGTRKIFEVWLRAFPDVKREIKHMVAEDDLVMVASTVTGTHSDAMGYAPASHKKATFDATDTWELKDGKIVGLRQLIDSFWMKAQWGLFDGASHDVGAKLQVAGVPCSNYEKSKAFYTTTFKYFGYKLMVEQPAREHPHKRGRRAGFGRPHETPGPSFWIEEGTVGDQYVHWAFTCRNHEEVEMLYKGGLEAGGGDNGKPGRRFYMPPTYYGGFIVDPDGHEFEGICWDPE